MKKKKIVKEKIEREENLQTKTVTCYRTDLPSFREDAPWQTNRNCLWQQPKSCHESQRSSMPRL